MTFDLKKRAMKTGNGDKVRVFRRILVSYNDFGQALDISSHILKAKLHRDYPEKDRHILQALNCAMIIAYARPFSGNRGSKTMLPALPERFLTGVARDEWALHKVVMKDRNVVLAHSAHRAWRLRPSVTRPPAPPPLFLPPLQPLSAPLHNH